MQGWIKLHRKFIEWEWYDDLKTKHLFLHLLLSANHKDKSWRGIMIKRGQLLTGRKKLAENAKLSEQSIRTSLKRLKSTNEISIKSTSKYSIITLMKWDEYQIKDDKPTNEQPASNQQVTTNKNVKNEKKFIISKPVAKNKNFSSISSLLKNKVDKDSIAATEWQEEALQASEGLIDGEKKKSSIFKCFKDNHQKSKLALNDCRELGKMNVLYFLKVYNSMK